MNRDAADLAAYLGDILTAIERIETYTQNLTYPVFLDTPIVQDAVIRNIEILGEASRNIMQHFASFSDEHPELPLASAYRMRNALAHGYSQVDLEVVWNTIQNDLSELYDHVRACIEQLDSSAQ
jgi:uncharacterized protein with HEPN domain